jgi:uncharacterized protein (DUF1810 family)
MSDDPWNLARFVQAQEGTYGQALRELRRGRKTSHWMWFVFPQVAGLGRSAMAERYAIENLDEARAYLRHPTLGARLHEAAEVVAALDDDPDTVFGGIDAMKLRSSMTLFLRAAPDDPVFAAVLDKHFGGAPDDATDRRLGTPG